MLMPWRVIAAAYSGLRTPPGGPKCSGTLPKQSRQIVMPLSSHASCPARVGLAGNPSDQFDGKVLAMTLANFEATVRITANPDPQDLSVAIVAEAGLEGVRYPEGLQQLLAGEEEIGCDGGVRLLW